MPFLLRAVLSAVPVANARHLARIRPALRAAAGGAHVAAVHEAIGRDARPGVLRGHVEDGAAAIDEHEVVVLLDGGVRPFCPPSTAYDVRCIEDVAQTEHELGGGRSQGIEGGEQLTQRAVRHVVDEDDVGTEAERGAADQVAAQREELVAGQGERQRMPHSRPGLHQRRKLQVVLVRCDAEERPEGRVGHREHAGVGAGAQELRGDGRRPAQVTEPLAVL